MLLFSCDTCNTKYPCEIVGQTVIYFDGNKRIQLKAQGDDCENCKYEIEEAKKKAREEIKKRKTEI